MGDRTVNIGLSLGADICWPIAYESLLEGLKLDLKLGRDRVNFACERVTIEPFDLRQPVKYDLVIDRLTHWYSISREWIKKAIVLNDLYVYNNPWSIQANEKHTSYCAMMRLGLPIPETWMLPAKAYEHADDLEPTLRQYAKLFSLDEVGEKVGYPFFMKPYHGGGWRGVTKIDDAAEFHRAYDKSGTDLMNLQKAVIPYDWFVRCIGLGPQTRKVNYDPSAPLHDRYTMDTNFLTADGRAGARGHDADDQRLLRLGLQLLRGAGAGRGLVSDRLRQRLPRQPGDLAALPLPVADQGQPALVDLLRRDRAQDAQEPRLGAVLRHRRQGHRAARRSSRATPTIARKRFETEKFRDFCRKHLGASRRARLRVLRLGDDARRDPAEGDGALPGARDRRVHRALLAARAEMARAGGGARR